MATADTSIYGNLLAKPPSLMDDVNSLDAGDLQRTQLAGAKINLIGQQQSLADQQAVRALYQRPGFDPSTPQGLADLSAASPSTALATRKAMLDNAKTQADTQHATAQAAQANASAAGTVFDTARKKVEAATGIVTSAQTPADAHAKFQQAVQQGLMTPEEAAQKEQEVPSDPAGFTNWKQASALALLTASQRIDAAEKQTAQVETNRHNVADESNAVRGQNITAQTARQNNAANITKDYRIAGYDANGNMVDLGLGGPPAAAPSAVPQSALKPGQAGPPAPPGTPAYTLPPAGAPAAPGAPESPFKGLIDSIGTYQAPESVALGRTPPAQKSQILAAVKQVYPDYDPSVYAERQAAMRSFAPNGVDGKAITNLNTAIHHAGQLSDAIDNLNNSNILPGIVNPVANVVGQQLLGNTAQGVYKQKADALSSELRKVYAGGGGGSLSELTEWQKSFDPNAGQDQQRAYLKSGMELLVGALQAKKDSYERGMGSRADFGHFITPESSKVLTKLAPDFAAQIGKSGGSAPTATTSSGATVSGW